MVVTAAHHEKLWQLAHRAADDLEGAPPEEVLHWASDEFGEKFCLTSSMADAALVHLASEVIPGVDVLFLDTGYHFAETLGTRDAVAAHLPVRVVTVTPEQSVAEQDAEHGPRLFESDPDRCCLLRKVRPLNLALARYVAWGSGIRRDETASRRHVRVVEWDYRRAMIKVNPLASWTQEQHDRYVQDHGVLRNPLMDDGYASLGCAPCTVRTARGENARAGRWAGSGKSECGLHGPKVLPVASKTGTR
jgi:phosphoadenosine phosphosulfate reductase